MRAWSLVLSTIAVVIAIAALLVPFWTEHYRRNLHLIVRIVEAQRVYAKNDSLFLILKIIFCNPASIPVTVYCVDLDMPEKYRVERIEPEYNFEKGRFLLSIDGFEPLIVPASDWSLFPVDIEPQHSHSCIIAVKLIGSHSDYLELEIPAYAYNPNGSVIANTVFHLNQPKQLL